MIIMYILLCEHCGRFLDKPRLKRGDMIKFNYCGKHRSQLNRYGKFLDNNQLFRTELIWEDLLNKYKELEYFSR